MICPKCSGKAEVIKTEPSLTGKLRLRQCPKHGKFWSLETLVKWLGVTATQQPGNSQATANAVTEPLETLEGGGGVVSLSSLSSGEQNPVSKPPETDNGARALRKGRGDAKDYPAEFERLWAGCTPHTGNKDPAFKQWLKHKPDVTLTIDVYLEWTRTDKWQRGYVPHLRKWLYEKGWQTRPSEADMSGPVNGSRQAVPFAVASEQGRAQRVLNDKLKRLQGELSPEPPPPDPRQEYAARTGGTK